MKKMRIGIYGGTFNPPHNGHVKAAEAFIEAEKLDKLIIMPDCLPPHKAVESNVSAQDRFNMCKIAFSHIHSAEISDFEMLKGGKSYTAVTLSAFAGEDRELYFLCGTDMFLTLDSWYDFKTIFKLAVICCVRRESDTELSDEIKRKSLIYKEKYGAEIDFIKNDVLEISSSNIRNSLGKSISNENLPSAVLDYINEKRLYL